MSPSAVWRLRGCAPGIGAGAAPGIGLAAYGGDGAIRLAPGEGLIGHLEGDAFAAFQKLEAKRKNGSRGTLEMYLKWFPQIANLSR